MFGNPDGPPLLPAFLLVGLVVTIAIVRSPTGTGLVQTPLAILIGLQAFRLPLELAMHHGAGRGIPIELTFSGFNFDIVTGIGAIVVAALVAADRCPRWLLWAWTVVGLTCLAVIFIVAAATLPRIHAFGLEPQHLNTWVAEIPFVWVPTFLVPVALGGHLLVIRALRRTTA
jgi:hypothetical protein